MGICNLEQNFCSSVHLFNKFFVKKPETTPKRKKKKLEGFTPYPVMTSETSPSKGLCVVLFLIWHQRVVAEWSTEERRSHTCADEIPFLLELSRFVCQQLCLRGCCYSHVLVTLSFSSCKSLFHLGVEIHPSSSWQGVFVQTEAELTAGCWAQTLLVSIYPLLCKGWAA